MNQSTSLFELDNIDPFMELWEERNKLSEQYVRARNQYNALQKTIDEITTDLRRKRGLSQSSRNALLERIKVLRGKQNPILKELSMLDMKINDVSTQLLWMPENTYTHTFP